jgi:hypothetical protein
MVLRNGESNGPVTLVQIRSDNVDLRDSANIAASKIA